jgi:dTDP-L-rhamnose 4-epimerase
MSIGEKILITGGAGFIGSNLALKLIKKGYNITVLDNLSTQIHGENPEITSPLFASIKDKVHFINGSVTERNDLESALEGQDVIVHLAAETGTGQSMYEIEKYIRVNVGGTSLLLDLLANKPNKVRKVVIASSRAIYGEGKYLSKEFGLVYPDHRLDENVRNGDFEVKFPGCAESLTLLATDEESKIHPSSVYGITKQAQEQLVMTVTNALGIAGVAFRYQNIYGPGQSLINPYTGILSIFSSLIRNNKSINIFEDGDESRDFVFIDDVVDATIRGIESDMANGQVFNVGSGVPTTVKNVVSELLRCFDIDIPVNITGNYRLGDIRHNYADISKINFLLNFTPKMDFKNGIGKFVNWAKNQSQSPEYYQRSLDELKKKNLFK